MLIITTKFYKTTIKKDYFNVDQLKTRIKTNYTALKSETERKSHNIYVLYYSTTGIFFKAQQEFFFKDDNASVVY